MTWCVQVANAKFEAERAEAAADAAAVTKRDHEREMKDKITESVNASLALGAAQRAESEAGQLLSEAGTFMKAAEEAFVAAKKAAEIAEDDGIGASSVGEASQAQIQRKQVLSGSLVGMTRRARTEAEAAYARAETIFQESKTLTETKARAVEMAKKEVDAARVQSKIYVQAAQKAAQEAIEMTVNELNVESTTEMELTNQIAHMEAKAEAELSKRLLESAADMFGEADADHAFVVAEANAKSELAMELKHKSLDMVLRVDEHAAQRAVAQAVLDEAHLAAKKAGAAIMDASERNLHADLSVEVGLACL